MSIKSSRILINLLKNNNFWRKFDAYRLIFWEIKRFKSKKNIKKALNLLVFLICYSGWLLEIFIQSKIKQFNFFKKIGKFFH
ncbi:MAG: hypothetical protein DWQ21_09530 [Bacteroidetes bacterium]|nr:MAG: hypothetical protein DWQ21_09530 [Bacteroidota bacterium]